MMIWDIHNKLLEDETINNLVGGRIKFYKYPEAKSIKEAHIIIDPIDVPKPDDYADNQWLTDDYMFQIDVWTKDMEDKEIIASVIRKVMWSLDFRQLAGGVDEYDEGYDIFRDARRYRGKAYRKDLNKL